MITELNPGAVIFFLSLESVAEQILSQFCCQVTSESFFRWSTLEHCWRSSQRRRPPQCRRSSCRRRRLPGRTSVQGKRQGTAAEAKRRWERPVFQTLDLGEKMLKKRALLELERAQIFGLRASSGFGFWARVGLRLVKTRISASSLFAYYIKSWFWSIFGYQALSRALLGFWLM